MNVKIPLALVQRLCKDYTGRPNWDALEDDRLAAVEELRTLLATPVVERQPSGYVGLNALGGLRRNGGYLMMAEKSERYLDIPVYTALPELAELQATIDHLRNDLEGTRLLAADQLLKINRLTAENERLKKGLNND